MTSTTKTLDRDLRTFMAVAQAVAIEEAKTMAITPEMKREARALAAFAREKHAEIRRAQLAALPSNVVSGVVRPSIMAMARDAVMARLSALFAERPQLGLCYREYEHATDDDLRSALEDVLSVIERGE